MGFFEPLKEDVCIQGFPEDWSIQEMKDASNHFFNVLEKTLIPEFFLKYDEDIEAAYESAGVTESEVSLYDVDSLNETYLEFSEAYGKYMQEMCGKPVMESGDFEEFSHLETSVENMLTGIFEDADEKVSVTTMDGLNCLVSLLSFRNSIPSKVDVMNARTLLTESATDSEYATNLAKLYLEMECKYALEFVETCEASFQQVQKSLQGTSEIVEESGSLEELQVF